MITVSAPGKIHFMGEHAVVYGKPALLTAINRRTRVSIWKTSQKLPSADPRYVSHCRGITVVSTEQPQYIHVLIGIVLDAYPGVQVSSLALHVQSDIPVGMHLGSSSAVAVATVGALLFALKRIWNPDAINKLAYEGEKIQHGNPSGGDNTISTFGGLLWYRKELEFLKSMWQLPFRPDKKLSHFYIVDTGKPKETTCEMVSFVKEKLNSETSKISIERQFLINEEQTKNCTKALKNGDEKLLITSIKYGEQTLEKIGVVSKKVILLFRAIEADGGAAKILGGGGIQDGVGYALCYHDGRALSRIVERFGYVVQPISLGEEGVRLEEKTW